MSKIYVRSFAETGQIQRAQVYEVIHKAFTTTLIPMFGRSKGQAFEVDAKTYNSIRIAENFIEVQPMQGISTGVLHFMHICQVGSEVCWINANTSGTMPHVMLKQYKKVDL